MIIAGVAEGIFRLIFLELLGGCAVRPLIKLMSTRTWTRETEEDKYLLGYCSVEGMREQY